MSKRDRWGKYKRQSDGSKSYEFYDKYGKKITVNSSHYYGSGGAFQTARSQGLSNRKPSTRGVD